MKLFRIALLGVGTLLGALFGAYKKSEKAISPAPSVNTGSPLREKPQIDLRSGLYFRTDLQKMHESFRELGEESAKVLTEEGGLLPYESALLAKIWGLKLKQTKIYTNPTPLSVDSMESLVHLTNQCVPLPDSAFPYLASLYQHAYKTTPSQIHDLKSVRDETLRQFLVRELQFLMESKDGNSLVKLLNESQDNHLGKRTLQTAAENVSNASPNEAIEAFLNIKDETTRFWLVRIALEAAWSKGATEIPVDAMGRITEESETITAFQTSCISLSLLINLRRSEEAFAEALKILPANLNAAKFEKSTRRRFLELTTPR